jgi:hypothetical protein
VAPERHAVEEAVSSFVVFLNSANAFSFTNESSRGYSHYEFPFHASGTATLLRLSASNDNAYFELDNVSVTPVPEPVTHVLLLSGGLAVVARRRYKAKL